MKKTELGSRVISFIQRHNLISPGEIVVVGVSGGADSVCLLHTLARCQKELEIKLHVAHLNHQLRGAESEADARYTASLADRLGIPITVDRQDVTSYRGQRNCSLEEAARELRYDFFATVAGDVGAKRVAVGHTKDDQVETILMHILRGTGTFGLRGLEPCSRMVYSKEGMLATSRKRSNLSVIRPLLDITREETMDYCQEYQLEPRIDSSNLSLSFLRNRCRLELLPLLRRYNPSVDQALLRLAEIARDDSSFIEQQALQLWDEVARQEDDAIHLNRSKFCSLPVALQSRIVRLAISKLIGDTRDIEAIHIEAIRSLLNRPVGKKASLPHGLICQSGYDELVLSLTPLSPCPFPPLQGEFPLKVPGETTLSGWGVIASIVQEPIAKGKFVAELDLHQAGTELFVRQRQPGDKFQPLGMNTPKKLQEFMIDAKIPLSWRECVPIVCSPKQIVWVVGWRIDDRVKITEATREILRLEFIKSP